MTRHDEVRDEMLMALADDELAEAEATALRRAIAADRELARRYDAFAQSRALLQQAFPPEPVPDTLVAAVRRAAAETRPMSRPVSRPAPDETTDEAGKVIALPRRTGGRPIPPSGASAWGLALAASVVLAMGAFWAGRGGMPVGPAPSAAESLAAAALSQSLTGEAVTLADGSTARALASFETEIGLCRLIGIEESRQIACRAAGSNDWTIALNIASGRGGDFVPASDSFAPVIDQMLDAINAGPTLGQEAEAAALGL
ncbi:MAG: hypothetical protein JJT81_08180 [Rubellimicrobium sp.]|nr:hypothetical protein [Rubellimicrobium sp.]